MFIVRHHLRLSKRIILWVMVAFSGCADGASTTDPNACTDPSPYSRAELVQVSVDTLRTYYGTTSGFEGGTLSFQEIVVEPGTDCAFEDTYIAYRVALPETLRPRPHDDQVAVSWGFDGTMNVFALNADNDSVYVEGQNPLSAIINFKSETPQADIDAYLVQLKKDYPTAGFMPLGGGGPSPGGSSSAIAIGLGRSFVGLNNPALVQDALAIQHAANQHADVEFVNLESYGFWKESLRGPVKAVEGETLHLECYRELTLERPLKTLTSLPLPLGQGRHYDLTECPINGWPAECEFEASQACKDAQANL